MTGPAGRRRRSASETSRGRARRPRRSAPAPQRRRPRAIPAPRGGPGSRSSTAPNRRRPLRRARRGRPARRPARGQVQGYRRRHATSFRGGPSVRRSSVPSRRSHESATAATVSPSQASSPTSARPAARWLSRKSRRRLQGRRRRGGVAQADADLLGSPAAPRSVFASRYTSAAGISIDMRGSLAAGRRPAPASSTGSPPGRPPPDRVSTVSTGRVHRRWTTSSAYAARRAEGSRGGGAWVDAAVRPRLLDGGRADGVRRDRRVRRLPGTAGGPVGVRRRRPRRRRPAPTRPSSTPTASAPSCRSPARPPRRRSPTSSPTAARSWTPGRRRPTAPR